MKKNKLDPMWKYTIYAYLAFWAVILVLGGLASMVFDAPPAVMTGITILGSWSPTIVLLLMLKKLKPGMTISGFYKRAFQDRLSIPMLSAIPLIVFGVFLAAVWLLSMIENTPVTAQLAIPSALGLTILLTALLGPSGEESGWRGYLRPELEGVGFATLSAQESGCAFASMVMTIILFWHSSEAKIDRNKQTKQENRS